MELTTNLLLTTPSRDLLADIRKIRPAWHVGELAEAPPEAGPEGKVWCFVDWICPQLSGLEMCRRLRESRAFRRAHLTMVLENDDVEARRRSLQAGADDYLLGPLDALHIVERVEVGTKAVDSGPRRILHHGEVAVDLAAHQVRFDGGVVILRPNEFRLFVHFLENPDQVFSRQSLIEQLGKHALGIDERTVDVWIGRLRRSLIAAGAPDPLRTVRSLGYVLDSIA
jgi:two-component system phosphate regulon response regulator PhoB